MTWCNITLLIWSACLCSLFFFHSEFVFLHVSHSFEVKHVSSQRGPQCQRQQEGRNVTARLSMLCLYCLVWVFFCLSASTCWLAVLPVLISFTLVLSSLTAPALHTCTLFGSLAEFILKRACGATCCFPWDFRVVGRLLPWKVHLLGGWPANPLHSGVPTAQSAGFAACVCVLSWCSMSQLSHVDRVCGSIFTTSAPYVARMPVCRPNAWSNSVRTSSVKGVRRCVYILYCPVCFLKLQFAGRLPSPVAAKTPIGNAHFWF